MLLLIAEISVKGQSDGTGQYQTCFLKWQIKSGKSKKKHCVVTFFVDQITAGDPNAEL